MYLAACLRLSSRHCLVMCVILVSVSACQQSSYVDSAAAREAGIPVTLDDLALWYPAVPDTENAALVCDHARSAYRDPDESARATLPLAGDAEMPASNAPLSQEMRSAIGQFLVKNDISVGHASRAASMSKSRFTIDFAAGSDAELPHLAPMRALTRLLALNAIMKAETGDAAAASAALQDALRIPEALKLEPLLISQLVRIACHRIASVAAERVSNRVKLSDGQLAELQKLAESLEDPDLLYRASAGEHCLILDYISKPENAEKPNLETGRLYNKALFGRTGKREASAQCMKLIDGSRLSTADRRVQLDAMANAVNETTEGSVEHDLASILSPLALAYKAHDWDTATFRVLSCGFAVKRFYLAEKQWPASLDALVPKYIAAVPQDPFSDAPIKYTHDASSATVYSIGRDGDDDRGQLPPESGSATEGDVVFRCYP